MPRPSVVTLEERIALVEKYINHFKRKPYPISTGNIWKLMSEELNGRWSAFNVYVNVSQNRRGILSTALSNKELFFQDDINVTCDSTMNLSILNKNEDPNELETESHDLDEFLVRITSEEWKQMKGPSMQYEERKYRRYLIEYADRMKFALQDFPIKLNLNNDEYRLAGTIAQLPGHYVSYCRRIDNTWELCNNMNTKVVRCNRFYKIEPSAVIYIKVSSKETEIFSSTFNDQSNDESFRVQDAFDDSDTQSQDNWRNKGKNEKISWAESTITTSTNETLIDKNTSQFSLSLSERSFDSTLMVDNKVYKIRGVKKT